MRSMRYLNQDANYNASLIEQKILIENDIDFTLGNNVVAIEHPITHVKIRRSLVNDKTYHKGSWRTDVTLDHIIKWYKSEK